MAARPAQAVLLAGSWVGCPRPAGWRAGAGPAPTSMPPPRHVPLLSEKERLANSNRPFSNFPLETLALPRPPVKGRGLSGNPELAPIHC